MKYYYLLTGLQDLQRDGKAMKMEDLLEQMQQQMPASDWALVELLRQDPQAEVLPEDEEPSLLSEADRKTQQYYARGCQSKNAFVRDWFCYNRDLNNLLTAAICRKHGLDVEKSVIGELPDDVAPEIKALSEVENLFDREKRQDALRWEWLEERTLFNNFDVENVLCYYLQCEILHRWDGLTMEEGEKVFKALVAEMKNGVKF